MATQSEPLRILLIGNGGREHALAWKLSESPKVEKIYVVPGNGGTADGLRKVSNVNAVKPDDYPGLIAFASGCGVNLVIPGPEVPLVAGIEGYFRKAGIRCFGPTKEAARMEGSKTFSKDFMARWEIPTAAYKNFERYEDARAYMDSISHGVVIKADGLAAGKGVILPSSKAEAQAALQRIMLDKDFGAAGDKVVIEELLEGQELSFLTFSDGERVVSLPPAQDHKRIYDGDNGPNTGGMGCYAPAPVGTPELIEEVHRKILNPTIQGMRKERFRFVGLLFTGIMVTRDGPKVLEYNVRFGDPECQTLLPLLSADTDLAEIMLACTESALDTVRIKIRDRFAATVVAAAGGYPGPYHSGDIITIDRFLSRTASQQDSSASRENTGSSDNIIFHAGTSLSADTWQTSGGRVIAATSTAATLKDAISNAYTLMSTIHFPNMHYRRDIGHRALGPQPSLLSASLPNDRPLSYADSGVSVSAGDQLVRRIKPFTASTARPGAAGEIGNFAGTLDLSAAGYKEPPTLVAATDGVGTKLMIAHAMNKHDTVGIDLVAMNVNDLIVQGAEPLMFLDVFSCGKLDVSVAQAVIKGVATGCIEADCALVGGESAEMPGIFPIEGTYDINGTAIGAVTKGKSVLPDKEGMRVGDVLLGLSSSGCHSNGFSLIRKIIQERAALSWHDPAPWVKGETVGESLLTPTRIYVKSVLRAVKKDLIKGMAHITGGGLLENIPRMLPSHLAASLDARQWYVPEILRWLKKTGDMEESEFARTFNTGLGMVLVVAAEKADSTSQELENAGEKVWRVGQLVERSGDGCTVENMEVWR
ncbi:MAG: hypothetical protein LQ350_007901 [Teloschistes chrysophthalmus]|nr:MAG: hypothetical protein LQ350_007901 [Niorma chrysophthalma]